MICKNKHTTHAQTCLFSYQSIDLPSYFSNHLILFCFPSWRLASCLILATIFFKCFASQFDCKNHFIFPFSNHKTFITLHTALLDNIHFALTQLIFSLSLLLSIFHSLDPFLFPILTFFTLQQIYILCNKQEFIYDRNSNLKTRFYFFMLHQMFFIFWPCVSLQDSFIIYKISSFTFAINTMWICIFGNFFSLKSKSKIFFSLSSCASNNIFLSTTHFDPFVFLNQTN